jgi:two-component system sensor histidine kinase BaeS
LLDDLLRDRESLLRHSGIVLDQSAGHGGLYVNGRREELRQLLAHVLVMACRAMPRGGLLDVRATARDGQGVIEFLDARSGGQEPLLAALFRHGSDNPQGPGQVDEGLRACVASCQRIVDGHRGRIDAGSSGAAGGAGLTIRLPLAGRPVKVE